MNNAQQSQSFTASIISIISLSSWSIRISQLVTVQLIVAGIPHLWINHFNSSAWKNEDDPPYSLSCKWHRRTANTIVFNIYIYIDGCKIVSSCIPNFIPIFMLIPFCCQLVPCISHFWSKEMAHFPSPPGDRTRETAAGVVEREVEGWRTNCTGVNCEW